ncbi:DUF4153 domain-containing protein [Youngiibacter multivorans]|uniref:Uncharacterized membrane protein YidH (DUF202 family) n=1 Tax=Youngiibacter multivorans TaxID=937251 RepID=A0ABS4G7C7_9CLOT|nr:DUF4153 domain-containing protein [Youngiibacter multivorans]MBP1920473.1 uncharacterized membrane protein YidH (DUF202 family) [Youngiibacter multivorans]
MENRNEIIENLTKPHELEKMYRDEPEAFKRSFLTAFEQNSSSEVLVVWYERLNYRETGTTEKTGVIHKDFYVMGVLAILAGISTRLIMHFADRDMIAPVNLLFGILPFICAYFAYRSNPERKIVYTIVALLAGSIVYMNLLPMDNKDTIILSYLHLPVFLWMVMGLAYAGNDFKKGNARLSFLKFNGEFCILYAAMAICGMILAALTIQLFSIAGFDISEFYFENIVLFGAAALSVVASYLVANNLKLAKSIAPYIAKIFSPLVLVTLIAYLIIVVSTGKNPFIDRNFLLAFNGILFSVLAVTIYSITESGKDDKKNFSDYINLALIAAALIIDGVALSAIVFRLTSYGITPNRVAVLGVNILIFVNLIWIISAYIRFIGNKKGPAVVQDAVTKYLPFYGAWAAFVTFAFPLIFARM